MNACFAAALAWLVNDARRRVDSGDPSTAAAVSFRAQKVLDHWNKRLVRDARRTVGHDDGWAP